MAKSARASSRKKNNAALRSKLFGPAIDARTERLSAKLQELVAASQPEREKKMEVDLETASDQIQHELEERIEADDDVEMRGTATGASQSVKRGKMSSGRVGKKVSRKAKHQMVFPSDVARRKRQSKSKSKK